MNRIKIMLVLFGYNLTSLLAHILLIFMFPIYCAGALFWNDEDFDRISDDFYKNIKEF